MKSRYWRIGGDGGRRVAAAWQGLARQAGAGNAEARIVAFRGHNAVRYRGSCQDAALGEEAMQPPNQFDLLAERRFAPFFWTQFLGAGNDNVYKNALVIFVAFHAATLTSLDTNALVNLAGAVFIAPFVLFSATAGQLADKLEKSRLIRWIKLFEIAIMAIGLAGFWRRDLTLLFAAPRAPRRALDAVRPGQVRDPAAAVEAGRADRRQRPRGDGDVRRDPHRHDRRRAGRRHRGARAGARRRGRGRDCRRGLSDEPQDPGRWHRWTPASRSTGTRSPKPWKNLVIAHENHVVWQSMLGISWFWFYGATFLAQFAGLRARFAGRRTSTSSRSSWRYSRSASASARCSARSCPDAASSWGSFRSARSASPVFAVDLVAREPEHARERPRGNRRVLRERRRTGASPPTSC
jgi:hypothetical protein